MNYLYQRAILGGTFDHLHSGHQKLIDIAFAKSEHVTIGLAKEELYKHKFLSESIETYEIREKTILAYLKKKNYFSRAIIIPISDIYGTTLTEREIEAIFVTEENLPNVAIINNRRQERGFTPLIIEAVPYVKDDSGEIITSERIRKGEITRAGIVYKQVFDQKTLFLPESLRPELQKPLGKIAEDTTEVSSSLRDHVQLAMNVAKKSPGNRHAPDACDDIMIIAVGDIIVAKLKEKGIIPTISIIDFKTRRHELARSQFPHALKAYNKPGTINRDAVRALHKALTNYFKTGKKQTIIISGEEDLLALPAILLAPLASVVLYGQFDHGVVVNAVTEETKQRVLDLVKQFH